MSEERLKEIKDSISYAHRISCDPAISIDFRDKEDLYNEVVRLRKIIDEVKEYTNITTQWTIYESGYGKGTAITICKEHLLDILKQNNLTLEQLTGVENA